MFKNIIVLVIFMTTTLFSAPQLEMFERFSKKDDNGPDTRGAIWYDDGNIFVADHGKGLWKIDECGLSHGDTTDEDKGLWDIWSYGNNLFGIGKDAMYIYDKDGEHIKTFDSVSGEGIYVQNGYAYIAHDNGITIVDISDINNPVEIETIMTGKKFSQIRGNALYGDGKSSGDGKELYVTTIDGELYLFRDNKNGKLTHTDSVTLFGSNEARKLFVSKEGFVYVNSNFGELAIIENGTLTLKDTWSSTESHGGGSRAPAAGGVFMTEIDGKPYALITAADGNGDGYLYWLDVSNPSDIKHVDTLHDTDEDYGFNNIWLNGTKIYLASHDGFSFMAMSGILNIPMISIKDSDDTYKEDITVTQNADSIGETKTFYISVENKHATEKLNSRLKAPAGDTKWEYKYYNPSQEITIDITKNEGYELELLPGESTEIKIEITPIDSDASDTTVTITASNKDSKEICGQANESDEVSMEVTFNNNTFSCSSNSYIFTSTDKDKPTDSYNIDILSGISTIKKSAFHLTNINAIGYNIKDNFIWGYDRNNEKVVRIDSNYDVISFDIQGLPVQGFIAGDVSRDGVLYLYKKGEDTIYRVDVDPNSATYLNKLDDLPIEENIESSDFAFNPIDHKLYSVDNDNGHLYRIEPTPNNDGSDVDVEDLGYTGTTKASGADYFDKYGNFYIYYNYGKIYKIDMSNPSSIDPKVQYLSDAPEFESKDGARCPNADVEVPPTLDLGCSLSFPGALSSIKDEIKLNDNVKVSGTDNHTLITTKLSTKSSTKCDGQSCQKSDTLADTLSFDLLSGDKHDGELKHNSTITSDKEYKKVDLGSSSTLSLEGDITLKVKDNFKLNSDSILNIKGDVTIYAKNFHLNSGSSLNIDGRLKVITESFTLNTGNSVNIPNPDDFTVFAEKKIDINSQSEIKGLFYSKGEVKINSNNEITGAITGKKIDINSDTIITYDSDAINSYCGGGKVDENETTPSQFNVWDKDGLITSQVITTKVVGENINLTLASLNEDGTDYEELTTDIKVALVSPNEQLTHWHDIHLVEQKFKDFTITPNDLHQNKNRAFKEVRVFIKYKDSNGTIQISSSSDGFAIRPDKFTVSVPSSKKASETFNLNASAVSLTDATVNSYNEQIKTSFNIEHKENKPTCDTADINFSDAKFIDGSLTKHIKYAEVGELDFNISEIPGQEFAIIDKDDTNDSRRYITQATSSTIEVRSAGFEVTRWTLDGGEYGFKYFSEMNYIDQMGAQLDVSIKAINLDGNVTKNYRDGCYIKDTNLTVFFDINGTDGEVNSLDWKDLLHSEHNSNEKPEINVINPAINNSFSYNIISSSFKNGESNESLAINFGREQTQIKNPVRLTINDINAINSDNASGHLPKNDQYVDFYYGRLHAANHYGNKNKEKVKVSHEVYCKGCDKATYIYANGKESEDGIYWYILKNPHYIDGVSRFSNPEGVNNDFTPIAEEETDTVSVVALSISTDTIDFINLQLPKLPFNDRIRYQPPHWLIYNQFNNTITTHTFNINIASNSDGWAGQGKKGLTIGGNPSNRSNHKMDW